MRGLVVLVCLMLLVWTGGNWVSEDGVCFVIEIFTDGHSNVVSPLLMHIALSFSIPADRQSPDDQQDQPRHSTRWNVIPRSKQMVADAGRVEVRGTVVITGGGGNIGEFEFGGSSWTSRGG